MLSISILLFFVAIFLLAAITAAIAWMGFVKRSVEESEAAAGDHEGPDAGPDLETLRNDRLSSLNFWDALLARFDFVDKRRTDLEQAELTWSVGRVTLLMLLAGTVVLLALSRIAPMLSIPGALAAGFVPYAYIRHRRNKRIDKFQEHFPDVLDSLARALRAGY